MAKRMWFFASKPRPARPAAFAGQVVVRRHLEGLDVHDRDVVLVFESTYRWPLAVAGGLLGRAAEVNRADDGAVLAVNDRGVGLRCG